VLVGVASFLVPAFEPFTRVYNLEFGAIETTVGIFLEGNSIVSSYAIDLVPVRVGEIRSVAIPFGESVITIVVNSVSGDSTVYRILVTRGRAPTLTNLSLVRNLDNATLAMCDTLPPGLCVFTPTIVSYHVLAPLEWNQNEVSITPTFIAESCASFPGDTPCAATVVVMGGAGAVFSQTDVTSGESVVATLPTGPSAVMVSLEAAGVVNTYRVTLDVMARPVFSIPYLRTLAVSATSAHSTMKPPFAPETYEYEVVVQHAVISVSVVFEMYILQEVFVNEVEIAHTADHLNSISVLLNETGVPNTNILVISTSADGLETVSYLITIRRLTLAATGKLYNLEAIHADELAPGTLVASASPARWAITVDEAAWEEALGRARNGALTLPLRFRPQITLSDDTSQTSYGEEVTNTDSSRAPGALFSLDRTKAGRYVVDVWLADPFGGNYTTVMSPRKVYTVVHGQVALGMSAWTFPMYPMASAGVTLFYVNGMDAFGNPVNSVNPAGDRLSASDFSVRLCGPQITAVQPTNLRAVSPTVCADGSTTAGPELFEQLVDGRFRVHINLTVAPGSWYSVEVYGCYCPGR